jgi:omega-6 fatty acid desaturase (delta-12 desaturase)
LDFSPAGCTQLWNDYVLTHPSRIPFYYAEEATEAIKPVLGDLYRRDERSFLGQLWDNFSNLKYVEPDVAVPGAMKWVTRA